MPYFVAVIWRPITTCCRWFLSLTSLRPAAIHIDPRMEHHCVKIARRDVAYDNACFRWLQRVNRVPYRPK